MENVPFYGIKLSQRALIYSMILYLLSDLCTIQQKNGVILPYYEGILVHEEQATEHTCCHY